MVRLTEADWTEVIVPEIEQMLGPEAVADAVALTRDAKTTGLRIRVLIAAASERKDLVLLSALKRAADKIEQRAAAGQ